MKEQLNLIRYELKYVFLGFRKHLLLCLSAISAITVSLFLVASFLIIGFTVDRFTSNVQEDLSIHVVLDPEVVSQEQILQVQSQIELVSNVDRMEFSSKEDELELMIAEKGEAFAVYRGDKNPLSNAFFVYVKDKSIMDETSYQIKNLEGVLSCAYGGSSVTELVKMLETIRKIGFVIIVLLLILSIYLVYNTIRTTIYSRQEEIIIMRQVGATNAFIKRPFEVQGIFIGLFGALIPVTLIYFGYPKLYEFMDGELFANIFALLPPDFIFTYVGLSILLIGMVIGGFASFYAANKYLKGKR